MVNRFRRFLSLVVTALMLVNMMGGAFAESASSDWQGIDNYAVRSIMGPSTVGVGETITLQGEEGYRTGEDDHSWSVSPEGTVRLDVQNQANKVQVTGLKPGTVTVTHRYRNSYWSSYWTTETFTLQVTGALTVQFDRNGGSGSTPESMTVEKAGQSITLPSGEGLSRRGYVFGGWSRGTNPNGPGIYETENGAIYDAGSD